MSIVWHFSPVLYISAFYMILEHTDGYFNDVIHMSAYSPLSEYPVAGSRRRQAYSF